MEIKIDRKARRHLEEAGGLLTLEATAKMGCLVTRQVEARAGKPEEPAAYEQVDVGKVTVFVRGTIDHGDGTVVDSPGAVPKTLRVGARGGELTVDAG